MWVYKQVGVRWEAGYYQPKYAHEGDGWFSDEDFASREEARARVHYLNGGMAPSLDILCDIIETKLVR